MHHFKLLALLIVISCLFYSCCVSADCGNELPFGQFRIVSNADGTDMVFGATKVFDRNEIKFYSVTLNDTTHFDCQVGLTLDNDSVLFVSFIPKTDIVYMRLSDAEIDTLEFSYVKHNSRCCGAISEIVGLRLNNSYDIETVNHIIEIRK